jgi:hypothetical protein
MDQDDDIQADWSATELSVLRSAELDVPAPGSVDRTLAALGVSAALGAGVGVGGATMLGTGARFGSGAHGSLWLKWLSAALVGGGIAGVVFFARHREKSAPFAASATNLSTQVASPAASAPKRGGQGALGASPAAAMVAEIPAAAPSARAAQSPSNAQNPSNAQSGARADAGDALAAEIRLIDEARDRLRRGDAPGSLETLARYDQLVKHGGSMRAEATVVRIEAYQRTGDSARAAALGQRFMLKNPDSPYVEYVKRMLAPTN